MGIPSVKKTALASMVALAVLLLPVVASAQEAPGVSQSAPQGLTLDRSKQTIRSVHRIDLTRDFATMPLHRGTAGGETVWFVITDVSDPAMARRLGVNFSPKLRNAPRGCPACVQTVRTSDPVLGRAPVEFEGAPDFNPTRTLVPGPTIVPPQSFSAGSTARPGYSPFVQVGGSNVVFNAPIIATGEGPFDVTTHTNTHDRTLGIDTQRMTVDQLFIRGFANGEPIFYLSFDVSEELTATVERSTFVPALDRLSRPNGGGEPDSARASIFQFLNSRRGLEAPSAFGATDRRGRAQGVIHALADGLPGIDAAISNPAVLEGFQRGADVSNVFDVFPTNSRRRDRREYSPAWDQVNGVYTREAVSRRLNGLKTDSNVIRRLAARGHVTSPIGGPLASTNVVINCPALAFARTRPRGPRVTIPGVRP